MSASEYRCPVYTTASLSSDKRAELLVRPVKASSDILALVEPILASVRNDGDEGLRGCVVKFDRCTPAQDKAFPLVLEAPFADELAQIQPEVKEAIDVAYSNIKTFHSAQMVRESEPIRVETMPGVVCQRFARPIGSVGLYVPGGTAVLPSTALMLGVPAQVAGCNNITLATPPRPDGSISPEIIYIAKLVGAQRVVRAGGAHAIAAMAYGTQSVPKADKLYGPGNQFVTAAKMMVAMDSGAQVAIDVPAGPSEVLVIADKTADPALVASDLLGQQEHGLDSQSVLVTIDCDDSYVEAVNAAVAEQARALPRAEILRKSLSQSFILQTRSVEEAFAFSNDYAPEHLLLYLENASSTIELVENAGSVFVGPWSPVACGDYASGTNHTLPTVGYAKQYSGVSTSSFLKHFTSQELSPAGLKGLGPYVERLADVEMLGAHKASVSLRLAKIEREGL
ncbi:trifunctional histidinol dehydrogenase/phosphoribosyl-AMP cyclohydrolase/phosphoribosyl-ATP diphosphatase [Rhodotorula paludigena]|uniref:trifunctional histidinol dehydrogenase/phosphoribosyl-AMP cyclohydrolase/phosphoribosyl-ATP diphosphatase n=1 Tax=Rhodotorula paludigena TaxID=86838 RepID=UPI00317C6BE8